MINFLWYTMISTILICISSASFAADSVTLRLKWFNQAQFAGFYIAKDEGFYKEENLDVSIQPGGPDFPSIQMIAGGNEHFGVTSADQILVARSKGVPVVAIAVLYRKSPFVLFTLKSSGIESIEQFVGKRIGVKIGGNEELVYRAMLKRANISKSSLTETPVKFDMTPLLTGQLDVWPGYLINEALTAKEKGHDINIIWPSDSGIELYADTLFTTEKMIKEKPELVKSFVAASIKGWQIAVANPEKAAHITTKQGKNLTYQHELGMMEDSIGLLKPDDKPIGHMEAERWQTLHDFLLEGQFIKKKMDISEAYTAQFLP
jgi:NitT/TauT family transport system substrate-binding protein